MTAGVSKSWREAVLIKLRAAGDDCRADVADFFRRDPTLPYKAGIMAYHLTLENATKPAKVAQPEINGAMTTILMDWLGEVHRHFMLAPPTLHIAASILHHYLRLVRVERKELQLVGTTALFIAGKYEEIFPPLAKDYAYLADAPNCNKEDIIATEAKILHTLEYNISQMAHALPFLTRYLQVCEPAPPPLSPLAHYLVELSLGADAERPCSSPPPPSTSRAPPSASTGTTSSRAPPATPRSSCGRARSSSATSTRAPRSRRTTAARARSTRPRRSTRWRRWSPPPSPRASSPSEGRPSPSRRRAPSGRR